MSLRVQKKDKVLTFTEKDKNDIIRGDWLWDDDIERFNYLLQNHSNYKPVETWLVQLLDLIQSISTNEKHIQILFSPLSDENVNNWLCGRGHWVCSYYDRKNIFIYDSMNKKILKKAHEQFLKQLFPTYNFSQNPVQFPTVQQQPNSNDCGVFAIAFAVSLLFNIKPDKVRYDHSLMRSHLIKMFESNIIEHFPQDLNIGIPQKVLPLREVRAKEVKADMQRKIRQRKIVQSKSCLLTKNCNSQQSQEGLNNNFLQLSQNGLYAEKIVDCEINVNKNNLCCGKVENDDIKIHDTNKNLEKKYIKECVEYKSYSEVKNINTVKQYQRKMTLSLKQKSIIAESRWLNDLHMDHFNHLLRSCSDYRPVGTLLMQSMERIQTIPMCTKHIQLLPFEPLGTHWTCCYYDTTNIFIYDSFNMKVLSKYQEEFLKKLFPMYDFINNPVQFPTVQQQPNSNDCGVFAIAFAVSLLFKIIPDKVRYDHSLMRSHLIKIFEFNQIEHFPQDLNYDAPQKVLPLTEIRVKEIEVIYKGKGKKRKYEMEQQKSNHLQTNYHLHKSKKILNNENNNLYSGNKQDEIKYYDTKDFEDTNVYKHLQENDSKIDDINEDKQFQEKNEYLNQVNYIQNLENYTKICQLNLESSANKRQYDEQDLLNNNAKKNARRRHVYQQDLKNNRIEQRERYKKNFEKYRANKKQQYKKYRQNILSKMRLQYSLDLSNSQNRIKKRCQYKKKLVKEHVRKQIYYFLHSQRERERQKSLPFDRKSLYNKRYYEKLPSDRKWLYNKRYYQKKCSHSILVKRNLDIAKNISKKYVKIRSRNYLRIRESSEVFIKNILHKFNITDCSKNYIEKRLEAEKIVRWCMYIRDSYICSIRKMLILLKNKSETCLTVVVQCSTVEDKLCALCGMSRHTASSENYFLDSNYHGITSSEVNIIEPLIINMKEQIENILPLMEARAKKSWLCSSLCKINDSLLIDRYQKLLEAISTCNLKNLSKFIQNIYECTVKTSNDKLGHTNSCYNDLNLCKALFVPMQLLSSHFPNVRYIRRLMYQLKGFHKKMLYLDEALYSTDLNTLNKIITSAQEKADMYKHQQTEVILSDDDIISKYHNAFTVLKKRSIDTPRYICISCERLCYKRNVSILSDRKLQTRRDIPIWKDLMIHVEKQKINPQYICHYCDSKFRNGSLPAYCILNNLSVNDVPEVISSLHEFEKLLIQRAKAFQTVVKMGTVINKKIPERQKIQKVKGRTFHLPLPLQQTLNKLCSDTDPINFNNEFFILLRNVPTKSKIIWEDLVDRKKIFEALTWLKNNNYLYSKIVLTDTHDKLFLGNADNVKFEMQETENDTRVTFNDEYESRSNLELHKQKIVEDHVEVTLNDQREAMLTQKDIDDNYYEQYTIYPLYEKRENQTATALYQMLKIQALPLDNREKNLDLMCFPDLFPFGSNGQCNESRPVKLQEHEFIKCRLTSKHPQFRLNQQYLFYLMNNANIRQLKRGIYHKINITDSRIRYTAAEYLEALSKEVLESNLNTMFSSLRNTEQYWRRPRSDLNCMTLHYGPATWFLTLSPSEWLWDDLGEYIREVNGWQNSSLSISALVAKDPVSTSRFLDNKFRAMLDFICSKDAPIGEVTHYFWRREYQGRGIQHFHLLIWIKDAPIFGESSIEEVSKFILQYISCKIPDKNISPLLYRRVNTHQRHKHNDYCLRSKKVGRKVIRRCRFGFPRPVTETLNMRDVATSMAGRKQLKHKSRLYDLPRTDNEVDINDYNPVILTAWEGNMDLQFVAEKSTVLTWYVTKYMNKAAKSELSEFDFANCKNNKNKSLASILWNFSLQAINNRECGALEAADTLLGISLYGTDRNTTIKWLDVNIIRQRKLKSRKEIEALDGESTEIFCTSVIDNYYPNRPEELESVSLYEFVQWYDITTIEPRNNIEFYKIDKSHYLKRRQRSCLINHYRHNVNNRPEEYFFSLLLMFKPWRKLEDLRDSCDTYLESFHKVKLHLTKALQYHEKLEELKKAFETAQELVRQLDEELQKKVSQDDPDNPIGVQNIEAGEAMQDFKDLGNKIDEKIDVSEMIAKLNTDQKRVLDRVIDSVRSDNLILRLYVSGEGGTGKSFLIKTIKCWIKQYLNKDTAVVAPTGIAAFNIDGLTVHRLLQLPVEHGQTPKYKLLSNHVLKVLRADLKDVTLFVIDEVSMISNLTLMYIHFRLSQIFDTNDCENGWFGRKHILLFGDLLQLSPVREDPVFVRLSNDKINKFIGSFASINLWTTLFDYEELTINMRQQSDDSYRQLLSRVRLGLMTKSDCEILESRKISFKGDSFESRLNVLCNFINDFPLDIVCLLPTRHMCDVLNVAMLNRIASKEILLIAEDTIDCIPYMKKKVSKVLSNNDDDNSKTAGLSKEIVIKIGAKVMIRRNIDASLGLVNGTIAKVISVVQDMSIDYVEKINLLLPSGLEYSIERVSVKFEVIDRAFVIRKQFPLCLSYGITIHKSQGLSLQNTVMDIGNSIFNYGQVYIALSRVTSLEGLHLINFDPSSVTADEEAIREYNRLRCKYKPEAEIITISKERYRKVKDIPWTLSKVIASVQNNCQNQNIQNVAWVLRGFQNADNVSCYANTVLQCLLHLNLIRKELFNCNKSNVFRMLMHRYENGMRNLNTYAIRQYLGEPFSINVKRDVFEFLTILCTKYDCIRQLVEYQVTSTNRCKSCDYTKKLTYNDLVISIPINNLEKKSYNLNDLLNVTFKSWCQLDNGSCEQCKGNDILFKKELTLTKDILIIHLMLFSSQDDKMIKEICKFNICTIPTTKVLIAKQSYKVMNAIFHSGLCIEDGHYTSLCREGMSNIWFEIDDAQIKKRQWPRGAKDIYIIYYFYKKLIINKYIECIIY